MEDLLKRINEHRSDFSKGQKRIADFLTSSYDEAAFMTAAKLGDRVGVSESTVVRFAYSIGLDGYPKLQETLQEMIRHRLTSVQRIRLAASIPEGQLVETVLTNDLNNIRATIEMSDRKNFEGAVSALLSARKIYVVGVRSAACLAQFLTYYLDLVFDNVTYVNGSSQDIYERMLRLGADDVCFGISFPRYSVRTAEAMRFAKKRGSTVIALTDQPSSPLAEFADHLLCARSDMASFADSLVAPLSLLNAVLSAIALARPESAYRQLSQLEQVWQDEGVYMTEKPEGEV